MVSRFPDLRFERGHGDREFRESSGYAGEVKTELAGKGQPAWSRDNFSGLDIGRLELDEKSAPRDRLGAELGVNRGFSKAV